MNGVDLCEALPGEPSTGGLVPAASGEMDRLRLLFCRSHVAIDSLKHHDREHAIRGDLTR